MFLKKVKSPKRTKLSQQDFSVLDFIWKWKVATTAALHGKCYHPRSLTSAYKRLLQLERDGFIRSQFDFSGEKFLWVLTKLGYLAVRNRLPSLKEEGYLSESPTHDLIASALHLGEWLLDPQENVYLLSEQQIRRFSNPFDPLQEHLEAYGEFNELFQSSYGVPNNNHRPDGLWCYASKNGSPIMIGLEIQVSPEVSASFKATGHFYRKNAAFQSVIWLVSKMSHIKNILTGLTDGGDKPAEKHNFLSFKSFIELGWEAKVELGSLSGHSIRDILYAPLGETSRKKSIKTHELLLNMRKSPHMAKVPLFLELQDRWYPTRLPSLKRKKRKLSSNLEEANYV